MFKNNLSVVKCDNPIVFVVELTEGIPLLRRPQLYDYKNNGIKHLIPCFEKDNKFFDIRSKKVVDTRKNCMIWRPVMVGKLLRYEDKDILVSRELFGDRKLLLIDNHYFNPMTMTMVNVG